MYSASNVLDDSFSAIRGKKVLVLGSSPRLCIPGDFSERWGLICVNASGRVAFSNSLKSPDVTVIASSTLLKSTSEFEEVRENIRSLQSAAVLIRFLGGGWLKRTIRTYHAKRTLASLEYQFEKAYGLSPKVWRSVVISVMGDKDYSLARNISTGVFCVILAIYAEAEKVVVAGIDPNSMGHIYSKTNFKREHKNSDARVLSFLQEKYGIEISLVVKE